MHRRAMLPIIVLAACLAAPPLAWAQERFITVASTTSTQDSGLFGYLLPIFKAKTGVAVHVIAQGTGQALDTGRRGDADVVFVHARSEEMKFLAQGFSTRRFPVMFNDFIIVGPRGDPAGIRGVTDVAKAMKAIADSHSPFASRGDNSGTNIAELQLWKDCGIDLSAVRGPWYREMGQGMGAVLNSANAMGAYTLSDRGTWIAFKNKGELEILVQGDRRLFNQYGVMLVNPAKFPQVKEADGQRFIDWLISPDGQNTLANYKIDGQQLFFPNANDPNA